MGTEPILGLSVESANGMFTAEFLPHPAGWMTGAIEGKVFANDDERREAALRVMDSIVTVSEDERVFSTCTDGRKRLDLEDGAPVPVREQMVGTDTVSAFAAAEALGERFYPAELLHAPVAERIDHVVDFLQSNGLQPTAHVACGAAGGFLTVINRSTQFITDPDYMNRLHDLLPDGLYDPTLHSLVVGSYQSRIDSGLYKGYRDGLITESILNKIGSHAVEHYENDGRGVNGHREQFIVYLDGSMLDQAIDPNALQRADGLQVFGVNSGRADDLAGLFGEPDSMDYQTARLAIEDFAAAGHGTLASPMETVVITAR